MSSHESQLPPSAYPHLQHRREMIAFLKSDLYELVGDGLWQSPLKWQVQFHAHPDRTVTIIQPDGVLWHEWPDGCTVNELDKVLP